MDEHKHSEVSLKYGQTRRNTGAATRQRRGTPRLPPLTVQLHDLPFTQLLQHIEHFLRLLGETVLTQLLQLSVKTERHRETRS